MSQKVLQINMQFSGVTAAELKEAWLPGAEPISQVPGVHWKVWLLDETRREAGGIYLFEDEASVQAFLSGPIAGALASDPALSNVSIKQFDIMEEHTAITRGPVGLGLRV